MYAVPNIALLYSSNGVISQILLEHEEVKILWGFHIQTVRHLEDNTPDIVLIEGINVWIIDIAIPGDAKVENKELEKQTKYRDLAIKTSLLWMKYTASGPCSYWGFGNNIKKYHTVL